MTWVDKPLGTSEPKITSEEPWMPPLGPEAPEKTVADEQKAALENIKQMGQIAMPPPVVSRIHCISIVGQVEGHILLPPRNKTTKYEHIIPQLVAVEQNPDIQGVLIILNTVGGDIEAGLAIAEMIKGLSKPTVSLVLGGGHSIGAPIAVAARYSFIADSATITIHPIRLTGLVVGVPQTYEYFDRMQERVVQFVAKNSKISKDNFRNLMLKTGELANDVGTILFGDEAVKHGLIDQTGGLHEALKKLYELIEQERGKNKGKVYEKALEELQ